MNIAQILQILQNSLTVATGMPGLVGMIFVALIGLVIAALLIAQYFNARGVREAAAYQLNCRPQQTQDTNLAQMQADVSAAMIENMNTVYQQDYAYFVQMLSATPPNTVAVYAKLSAQTQAQLASFHLRPSRYLQRRKPLKSFHSCSKQQMHESRTSSHQT